MKGIKFRAWGKQEKEMIYSNEVYPRSMYKFEFDILNNFEFKLMKMVDRYNVTDGEGNDTYQEVFEAVEADIMQYIGRKDSEGKEIYEGDIVELNITYWNNCNKEERKFIGEITDFRGLGWSIRYKDKDNNIDYPMMWLLGKDYMIEVKGNIYENPELLNG